MSDDIPDAYRVLELEPGASLEDIKCAYRVLVKVWHPDRFAHDPDLQKKAQEKLKQINLAYEQICKAEETQQNYVAAAESAHRWSDMPDTPSAGASPFYDASEPADAPPPPPTPSVAPKPSLAQEINWGRQFLGVTLIIVTLAVYIAYNIRLPWLNLLLGITLILTPLDALGFAISYFLLVVPIVVGWVLGSVFGAPWLGVSSVISGLICGALIGAVVLFKTPYCGWIGSLHRVFRNKIGDKT